MKKSKGQKRRLGEEKWRSSGGSNSGLVDNEGLGGRERLMECSGPPCFMNCLVLFVPDRTEARLFNRFRGVLTNSFDSSINFLF